MTEGIETKMRPFKVVTNVNDDKLQKKKAKENTIKTRTKIN